MSERLQMIFQTADGSRRTISVDDPRADLTAAEIQAAMNTMITGNVFQSSGGDLVGIIGARTVTTEITEFDVA